MKNFLNGRGSLWLWALILSTGWLLTSCQTLDSSGSSGQSSGPDVNEANIMRLRAGDSISVVFSGVPNAPERLDGRITEDGFINLPLIGAVKASGKLMAELEKEIHDAYINGKFFNVLTVNIASESRSFAVAGEVRNNSRQVWAGHTTVISAISAAQGFTDYADKKHVRLIRANGKILIVNCVKALSNPELNLPVYPGDQINVPRRWW